LVLASAGSVQLGAAVAKGLFDRLGPDGATLLRVGFAALLLVLLGRPRLRGHSPRQYAVAALFGLALAAMNLSFYAALDRIPLGVAVTLEFVGPLGVAVAGSRRALDALWVAMAAAGILLLAPFAGAPLDSIGVALALVAGGFWAAYILLGKRLGRAFGGGDGLALAMCAGTVALLPVGVLGAGWALLDPTLLLPGFAVALLSSVIPYTLEIEALRRLPTRVFGVLLSVDPALAALVGFLVLGEALGARGLAAVALVSAATAGATRYGGAETPRG
jgi:inner membrane transporter RhtA